MTSRSAAVLATGTAHTAKLFVTALVFTGAYVGFSAYDTANSAPTQTLSLASQTAEVATPVATPVTSATSAPGSIAVSVLRSGGCRSDLTASSVAVNADASSTLLYGWRLMRWSPTAKKWHAHLAEHAGFSGAQRTVTWETRVVDNPGWYRIDLAVKGGTTVKSDRFQVTC
ncbi:MAG: hypothetical protein HOV86_00955 [Thermoactinospora sp.]|nr:hypothetical protein [Thermoactinospora sp.]